MGFVMDAFHYALSQYTLSKFPSFHFNGMTMTTAETEFTPAYSRTDPSCFGPDYLESPDYPGPKLILASSTAMLMIFVASFLYIWSIVVAMSWHSFSRSRQGNNQQSQQQLLQRPQQQPQQQRRAANPFYNVTFIFYIFIMLFCLARALYYATVVVDGIVDLESLVPVHVVEFVQVLFYHSASTWFYCGFLIINFNWAGWYLYANGLGPWKTYRLLRTPRLAMFVTTGAIVAMQAALMLLLLVVLALNIADAVIHILLVLQLVYHSFLGLLAVLTFAFWLLYAKAKKTLTRGMSYRQSMHSRLNLLLAMSATLTLLILFKSIANAGLAVMRIFADFCKNSNVAVVAGFGIIVDILPVLIVIYVLSHSFSADEGDYEDEEGGISDTPHLSISKVASEDDPLLGSGGDYQINAAAVMQSDTASHSDYDSD